MARRPSRASSLSTAQSRALGILFASLGAGSLIILVIYSLTDHESVDLMSRQEIAKHVDEVVREMSGDDLEAAAESRRRFRSFLISDNAFARRQASAHLKVAITSDNELRETVLTLLQSEDPYVRRGAARALDGLGELAPTEVSRICDALKAHVDSDVGYYAFRALLAQSSVRNEVKEEGARLLRESRFEPSRELAKQYLDDSQAPS